jgi:hypothetical protein
MLLVGTCFAGCSGDSTSDRGDASAGDAGSSPADASSADASVDDGGNSSAVEVCDGIDNDGNGIIDDVDVGHDGVCDCLRIATLGYRGKWGVGDVFSNWLDGKSINGAVSLGSQTLTAQGLVAFQVIVVQDVRQGSAGQEGIGSGLGRTYSSAEVQALKAWVDQGGGLMTLTGYADSSEIANVNKLLSPFGLSYGSTPILPKNGSSTKPVTHWATHPVTEAIARVGVDNGYPVMGGTLIAWEPAQGSWDLGRVVESGAGHVLSWGDEWITYDSEWSDHPDYQVERFWLNALKWLTVAGNCQVPIKPN